MDGGPRIAIDAMGGDSGPAAMIAGASRALRKRSVAAVHLSTATKPQVARRARAPSRPLLGAVTIVHSPEAIAASEKPSQAIRRARTTSMGMAINAVKEGTGRRRAVRRQYRRADGDVQARAAHHAGDRPAGARRACCRRSARPTCVMLDLGANTECDAQNLVQFAVMGAAYARTVLGIAKPRVKLLNIGTEELKGTDELKDAAALLREADYLPFRFDGFTEGDQLSRGEVDVVVTDGFSGNIALKTAEGTARFVTDLLRRAFKSSLRSKAGFALSRPALNLLQGPPRPQQPQWRGLPRPQRPGREEPRRRQPPRASPTRSASPRGWSATTSPARSARISTISAPTPSPTRPRNDAPFGRRSASAARCRSGGSPTTSWRRPVDTTDEWIVERTGIRSRYIAGDGETTATPGDRRGAHARSTHAGHRRDATST